MRTTLLALLLPVLAAAGTSALGAESIDSLLQKRTLDFDIPKQANLSGALSDLAARYKGKFGDELPVFISVALLLNPSPPGAKPMPPPTYPGTDVPAPADSQQTRLGGRLHNVPILEILRYYANLSDATFTIRGDVILFHKSKKTESPNKSAPADCSEPGTLTTMDHFDAAPRSR